MKATTVALLALLCVLLGSILFATSKPKDASANSTAPPSGYTAAPGDLGTCANCHTGISGTGFVSIATTRPFGYVPGVTETLTVLVLDPNPTLNRWGFEAAILSNSDNLTAGTITPTAFHPEYLGTGVYGGRTYLSQRSNGALAPMDTTDGTYWGHTGGFAWHFLWTGPPQGTGGVTIYISAVATNGDGAASGADNTYTINQYIAEMAPTPVTTTTWGKIKKQYH